MSSKTKTTIPSFFILLLCGVLLCGVNFNVVLARTLEKKQAVTPVPTIYPRSAWASSAYDKRTKKIWPAQYDDPQVIIVHHTATNYKSSTAKQIKKIYRYHSYTRKWGDIGYNYIIGPDGAIFEGRYGGNGAIGGHAWTNGTNFNAGSIGIAILGDYQKKTVSSEALESLKKLVGWLSANNGFTVADDVSFHGKHLDTRMVGHKDVGDTECPGKNLYNRLSDVRSSAGDLAENYQNYAYKMPGDAAVYEIAGGKRYSGSAKTTVVDVSASQLKAYDLEGEAEIADTEGDYAYPSGTLVKVAATGQKGILSGGAISPITDATVLALSYKDSNFIEISADKWNSYSAGSAAVFRSGTLVKDENGKIYSIVAGQKRLLTLSAGEAQWVDASRLTSVSSGRLSAYPSGEAITSADSLPAGTIITNNGKKYFMVVSPGVKKEISKDVFKASFTGDMAARVSKKLTQKYKNAGYLPYQDGATISYRSKYVFVENGKRRAFASKGLAKSMGFENFPKAKRRDAGKIPDGAKIE